VREVARMMAGKKKKKVSPAATRAQVMLMIQKSHSDWAAKRAVVLIRSPPMKPPHPAMQAAPSF